jgi:hypothetical protein
LCSSYPPRDATSTYVSRDREVFDRPQGAIRDIASWWKGPNVYWKEKINKHGIIRHLFWGCQLKLFTTTFTKVGPRPHKEPLLTKKLVNFNPVKGKVVPMPN